jgi:hypothetical protein
MGARRCRRRLEVKESMPTSWRCDRRRLLRCRACFQLSLGSKGTCRGCRWYQRWSWVRLSSHHIRSILLIILLTRQGLLLRLREHAQVGHNSARVARELLIPNDVSGDHNALNAWIPELPALEVLRITQEQAR